MNVIAKLFEQIVLLSDLWWACLWQASLIGLGMCVMYLIMSVRWRDGIAGQRDKERLYKKWKLDP